MKTAIIIVVIGFHFAAGSAFGQTQWQTYTSPDKRFSVEAPALLRKVPSFDGEHGANLAPDQKISWATCYAVIETTPDDARFGVVIVNGRLKVMRTRPQSKVLSYLSAVLIGDDDDPRPKIQKRITVNGLAGNEYFHIRDENAGGGNQSPLYTRGRIFDQGNRVYVVTFIGRDQRDLTSFDAQRFLNSFRLVKQRRRTRHARG